jgi:CRP-like cAMP-binding protein
VWEGSVSIILNSPDGHEMVINEMQKGDLFGELLRELRTSQPEIKIEPALA